jgi:hypothetical protein
LKFVKPSGQKFSAVKLPIAAMLLRQRWVLLENYRPRAATFGLDGRKVKVLGRKRREKGKSCGGVEKGARTVK